MQEEAMEELATTEPGTLTATAAHAKFRAILALRSGIAAIANDAKFLKGE